MSGFHWHANEVLLVLGLSIAAVVLIAKRHRLGLGPIDFALLGALAFALLVAIGEGAI